jgi:hypothetical protein
LAGEAVADEAPGAAVADVADVVNAAVSTIFAE